MGKPKIFVLDTNVPLHDHKAIRRFRDNNLVIPIAVVEELDKFKKGNDTLSYNARHFLRDLDKISEGKSFGQEGLPIGKDLGLIKVEPNHPFPDNLKGLFIDDIQDHRILATAIWVRDNHPGTFVALVTKDVNLRMKAKAAGMEVQDYLTDRVDEARIENANSEVQYYSVDPTLMQELVYGSGNAIDWKHVVPKKPEANQLFTGDVEVLVTDGFTGNVLLKGVEGTLKYMLKLLKGMFYKNAKNKVAGLLIKSEFGDLKAQLDPSEVGGTALLGISKPVIKAHGSSDARAFQSAIRQAIQFAESRKPDARAAESFGLYLSGRFSASKCAHALLLRQ